ncbi:MAG: HIT family protein, partial [Microgenomates group bacterium]
MNNCIFCQIVAGKIPCYKVYEDENFLAFLDIYPRTKGHTLLIPKIHYQWVYDVPNFAEYWLIALKITKAMKKVFSPYFITYLTHGLQVPHAHIHIMPRTINETGFIPDQKNFSKEQMREIAQNIYQTIKND